MPDDALREKVRAEALKSLKQIIAGRGRLGGHFFFAGDGKMEDAALYVTLTAKDPKGSRARSRGKALRKDVARARFALGTVRLEGSTLIFSPAGGNASPALLRKSLKGPLCEQKGLAFLRKARVQASDETDEDVEGADAVSAGDLGMSDGDLAAMEQTLRDDPDLAGLLSGDHAARHDALNRELAEAFLSAEALEAEQAEQRAQLLAELGVLEASYRSTDDPDLEARIEDACQALAALSTDGRLPFADDTLPAELQPLVRLAADINIELLALQHAAAAAAIQDLLDQMEALPEADRPAFAREHLGKVREHRAATRAALAAMRRAVGGR